MSKRQKVRPRDVVTKRQLSRWQKEKRTRRIITIVVVVAVIAIIAVVGYGIYATQFQPWGQPIARVNNVVFDMNYFVKMFRLSGGGLDASRDVDLAYTAVAAMQNYELGRLAAVEFEIYDDVITPERLEETTQQYLNSFEEPITKEAFIKGFRITETDFDNMVIKPLILLPEVQDYIGERDVPYEAEQVRVQAMLLETEEVAIEVRGEWNDGEDFHILVDENSPLQDYDEEWLPRGVQSAAFDEAVFSLAIDELSEPIHQDDNIRQTGYWLVKLFDEEKNRTISDENRDVLIEAAFISWLEDQRAANTVESYLDSDKIIWARDHLF